MHKYGLFLLVGEKACHGIHNLVWVNYSIRVPKIKSFVAKSVPEQGLKNRHASVGAKHNESSHPQRLVLSVCVDDVMGC